MLKLEIVFQAGFPIFHLTNTVWVPDCPAHSSTLGDANLLNTRHFGVCVVVSHCGFHMHFPDN